MTSVLVFSKDRPMQLHAYLESLIRFSDILEDNIAVLYCHGSNISYENVKRNFPDVCWIEEYSFYKQVLEWIYSQEADYIMFGCDDVIFTKDINFSSIEMYLEKYLDVFGFSLRLGKNLKEFPSDTDGGEEYCSWEWKSEKKGSFYYPWELDCTVYRITDVKDILTEDKINIKNPNYLEEFVALCPEKYIKRNRLACYYSASRAIVITVNRVQDTHKNPVDDSMITDVESLSYLYNKKDVHLDINKIAKKKNSIIHVGAEYFILDNASFQERKKSKLIKRIKQVIKNLKYLSKIDMESELVDQIVLSNVVEIASTINALEYPNILNAEASIEMLETAPKSFCRLGDGELMILMGKSIPFQKYEDSLKQYLQDIITYKYKEIYVGLPYFYYQSTNNLNPMIRKFVRNSVPIYREIIDEKYIKDKIYLDTSFTQIYQTYYKYDFEHYFERVKRLFDNKKITLLMGEGLFNTYEYDLFEYAIDFELIEAPRVDAFSELELIIERLLHCEKDRLICVVLGPTAKAIVVELDAHGYMVWDIGHLVKDYNYYMEGTPRTSENITSFYRPE